MKEILLGILIIVVAIVLIGIGPVFTILSLNALFNTTIAINFTNWLATLWLGMVIGGVRFRK